MELILAILVAGPVGYFHRDPPGRPGDPPLAMGNVFPIQRRANGAVAEAA